MTVFRKDLLNILYVHVPKTGGGSIHGFFEKAGFETHFCDTSSEKTGFNALRTCSPQHYHAFLLKRTLLLQKFDYIFLTVRHPIDRLKSEFIWRNRGPDCDASEWANQMLDRYARNPFLHDNHFRPQHEFHLPQAEIIRTEADVILEVAERLATRFGIVCEPGPTRSRNVARTFDVKTVADIIVDPPTLDRVTEFYRRDFELYGYEP